MRPWRRNLALVSDAYFDHAATTPLRPEARAAMEPVLDTVFGNPSGSHRWAREARRRLDDARDQVAEAVGAEPGEVVFTSGGTEADNLAVTGSVAVRGGTPICGATEHHAVLDPVKAAGGRTVGVDALGRLDLDALVDVLQEAVAAGRAPAVVSVMTANNETGVRQPVAEIVRLVAAHAPGTPVHTDAVAAAAWVDLPSVVGGAHMVSLSGHKVGAPKGIGALVVRRGTRLSPLLRGGGQEHERRSGTQNVTGAVAFGAALAATVAQREGTVRRVEALRERLAAGLRAACPHMVELSPTDPAERTAGTLQVAFPDIDREELLFLLDDAGIGASWGSSCTTGAPAPSHVLGAMGVPAHVAKGALRLSLGWCSTDADIDAALAAVPAAVDRLSGDRSAGATPVAGGGA